MQLAVAFAQIVGIVRDDQGQPRLPGKAQDPCVDPLLLRQAVILKLQIEVVRPVAPAACGMNRPCRGLNAYVKVGYKRECDCRYPLHYIKQFVHHLYKTPRRFFILCAVPSLLTPNSSLLT